VSEPLSGEQNRFVDAVINQVRHQFNFSPLHTHRERADDLFTATKQQKTTTTTKKDDGQTDGRDWRTRIRRGILSRTPGATTDDCGSSSTLQLLHQVTSEAKNRLSQLDVSCSSLSLSIFLASASNFSSGYSLSLSLPVRLFSQGERREALAQAQQLPHAAKWSYASTLHPSIHPSLLFFQP
jgi:hypothetical protein